MRSKLMVIVNLLNKIYNYVFVSIFVVVFLVCMYVMIDSISVIGQGAAIEEAKELIKADDNRISTLKKVNQDVVAWITLDDTKIDYPIVQTNDNQFYLKHNYKKDYSMAGSIFADYRSDLLKDDYAVIYGHNMSGKNMFGYLSMFEDKSYFDAHKTGKIYFEDEEKDLDILAYGVVENSAKSIYEIDDYRNNVDGVMSFVRDKAQYMRDGKHDKILLLSTCYTDTTRRIILLVGY